MPSFFKSPINFSVTNREAGRRTSSVPFVSRSKLHLEAREEDSEAEMKEQNCLFLKIREKQFQDRFLLTTEILYKTD